MATGMRRRHLWIIVLLALGAVAAIALPRWRHVNASSSTPTAQARRGDFAVFVRVRGELKARRSVQVSAPVNVPELRIVWLASPGAAVKQAEVVIRFDPRSARQQLEEKRAALQKAQAELDQAIAEARISAEQDKIELADAQYEVKNAKLEASKAEIVSRLQGEESKVDLGLAEQKLALQKTSAGLNEASNQAKIASLEEPKLRPMTSSN